MLILWEKDAPTGTKDNHTKNNKEQADRQKDQGFHVTFLSYMNFVKSRIRPFLQTEIFAVLKFSNFHFPSLSYPP